MAALTPSISPRAGLVASRQTFVRRRHGSEAPAASVLRPVAVRVLRRSRPDRGRGHAFAVVDNLEAAIATLVGWGVLRGGIHLQ